MSALLALSRVQEEEGGPAAPYLMDFRTDLKVADIDVVGWLSERDQWIALCLLQAFMWHNQ